MGMSRTIATYTNLARILDAALAAGGATFRLETPGRARHFIQRAYFFRKLLHDQQAASAVFNVDTRITHTPYDSMKLTRKNCVVTLSFDEIEGVLLDGEGNPLELPDTLPEESYIEARALSDDLDKEALDTIESAKRELGLESE